MPDIYVVKRDKVTSFKLYVNTSRSIFGWSIFVQYSLVSALHVRNLLIGTLLALIKSFFLFKFSKMGMRDCFEKCSFLKRNVPS